MAREVETWIAEATGASRCRKDGLVQRLWSGYGQILRYRLEGASRPSVIVKHISPPGVREHPRGWNTDRSHQRKLKSYQVEAAWYEGHSARCGDACRVPECLAMERKGDELRFILEDLDASGFPGRRESVTTNELHACIDWLARFHATFLGSSHGDLWASGTYWHLATRPDELTRLASEDPSLWRAAKAIDAKLEQSKFQTLVHGDAKLANFCFSPDGTSVAAVDFQYVGRGCGMKDLAYFIGSCFGDEACEAQIPGLLDHYFSHLRSALDEAKVAVDGEELESEWRTLFPFAWTDFHRFLKGWSPGHWKIHAYSDRLAQQVITQLDADS